MDRRTDALRLTLGEFLNPLRPCHIEPPMAPIANAVPQSSSTRHGLWYRVN